MAPWDPCQVLPTSCNSNSRKSDIFGLCGHPPHTHVTYLYLATETSEYFYFHKRKRGRLEWWYGPVGQGACCQARGPEFRSQDHVVEEEPEPDSWKLSSDLAQALPNGWVSVIENLVDCCTPWFLFMICGVYLPCVCRCPKFGLKIRNAYCLLRYFYINLKRNTFW